MAAFQAAAAADPANIYNLYEPDPALGWRHRPGAAVRVTDLPDQPPFTVRVNDHGLIDRDYPAVNPPGGLRLLVLGDSFTEAVQVPAERRSFQMVEDRAAALADGPYEIIEMGVARYSPAQYYRAYLAEGRRYDPDVVIVLLYLGNDIEEMRPDTGQDVVLGLDAGRVYQYTLVDGALTEVPADRWRPPSGSSRVEAPLPVQRAIFLRLIRASVLADLLSRELIDRPAAYALGLYGGVMPVAARLQADYTDPLYAQVWPVFEAVLVALRDAAEADGAQFAVVIAPEMDAIDPEGYFARYPAFADRRADFDGDRLERQVTALLEANGIAYFSLTPALRAAAQRAGGAPLYYASNTHWTPAGHAAAAEALAGWLARQGWAPPGLAPE